MAVAAAAAAAGETWHRRLQQQPQQQRRHLGDSSQLLVAVHDWAEILQQRGTQRTAGDPPSGSSMVGVSCVTLCQ
jgi:hypothetical protein